MSRTARIALVAMLVATPFAVQARGRTRTRTAPVTGGVTSGGTIGAQPLLRPPSARVSMGMSAHEKQALGFVKSRLGTHFDSKQYKITVAPSIVQDPGNRLRPISGDRPLAVETKVELKGKPSFFKRLMHKLRPTSKTRYYVTTDAQGTQHVVGQQSETLLARLRRALPVAEKLHDMAHSEGVRHGAITAGLSLATSTISVPVAMAGIAYAAVEMFKGVQRRSEARREAVLQTSEWAKISIERGVKPTAVEAFATYKEKLDTIKHGTHPGSMERFLDRLATHGL